MLVEKTQERIKRPRAIKKKGKSKGGGCQLRSDLYSYLGANTGQGEEGSLPAFQNDLCFHFSSMCSQMQPPSLPISSMRWTV